LERPEHGLELTEVGDPRVLGSLARVDAMNDAELRALVAGEPRLVVEAAEAMIGRRRAAARQAS
jgi:translation elongation factor EF-Tu-like GTPase